MTDPLWLGTTSARDPQTPPVDRLRMGEQGELSLPEALRRSWGLAPGAEIALQETPQGLLLRRADPALTRVYVEPTARCNLSCRTCVRRAWSEPEGTMDMATYRRLLAGLRGVPSLRSVAFWGFGEPLLHPHIVEMVALARELGARTELITNGLLLDRGVAEGLVLAGLDTLVVSVDGTTPQAHADVRPQADLRRVQENLGFLQALRDRLARRGPEIGLEFVAMRRNVAELPRLPHLAYALGASFLVITNLLPHTEEMKDQILYGLWAGSSYPRHPSAGAPEIILPRIDAQPDARGPLLELLRHVGVVGPDPRRLSGAPGYCRFVGEGALAVGWDGAVSPCVALMHSYPCYVMGRPKRIRRYVLGNVDADDVSAIWQRDEFVRFRARVLAFDFSPCTDCGGCEMAETNEEDCFGNPFPVCGDCLWAKGVLQCP